MSLNNSSAVFVIYWILFFYFTVIISNGLKVGITYRYSFIFYSKPKFIHLLQEIFTHRKKFTVGNYGIHVAVRTNCRLPAVTPIVNNYRVKYFQTVKAPALFAMRQLFSVKS